MQYAQRGAAFAKIALAKAATQNETEAMRFAVARWGPQSSPALELKAAVAGGAIDDADYAAVAGTNEANAEFLDVVQQLDLIGKLGLRHVPSGVPVVATATGATSYWVGESKAVPVSRAAFERLSLFPKKLSALTVVSNELLQSADPKAEQLFLRDLIRSAVALSDSSFIDPSATGTDAQPASVTAAAATIASVGDLADDCEAAIEAFTGSLVSAAWVCHPRLAVQAGIRANGTYLSR